jgi:ComF family protein
MLNHLLSLIYPNTCISCNENLFQGEKCLCTHCRYHLPITNYHKQKENPISQQFWGRVQIHAAASYCFFNKETSVQTILHQLKYKGRKDVGLLIGQVYGQQLKESELYSNIDAIVPVPLHPIKQRKRGYNQSEQFADGIAEAINRPVLNDIIIRKTNSNTQTSKNRYDRWSNVDEIFDLNTELPKDKRNILLVDDVVTTGATLEACANVLFKAGASSISIATIACA